MAPITSRRPSSSIPELLASLPRREFRAGLYEVVKYGVIASRPLFEQRRQRPHAALRARCRVLLPVIAECCQIKGRVVEEDERESGPRRALNFGHTLGHALEAVTKYRRFRHGEAVGYGMLAAANLSVARGVMPAADRDALASLIAQMGPLPCRGRSLGAAGVEAIARDKKVIAGQLHFVLPLAHRRDDDGDRRHDRGADRRGTRPWTAGLMRAATRADVP